MQRMREDLVRRNYAESTIRSYLHTLEDFRRYAQRRLDHLGSDDIRRYQVYLREERKLDIGTASNCVAALRFFYVKTLKRPSVKQDLPYPHGVKRKRRLPTILSQEEVGRLIDSSKNLFHYAMLLTIYLTGLRRSELCRLKVANIDSQRMMLRVERGKGDVDREVPISQKLVDRRMGLRSVSGLGHDADRCANDGADLLWPGNRSPVLRCHRAPMAGA